MKKHLLIGAALLVLSGPIMAAETGPGCGAGSVLFKGQTGLAPHVLAATTNGIYGNQTFAMSTGTWGCDVDRPIGGQAAAAFLDDNLDKVARDMAAGGGEALDSFATLLGVDDHDKPAFFAATKQHFVAIFAHESVNGDVVMTSLNGILAQDPLLSRYAA